MPKTIEITAEPVPKMSVKLVGVDYMISPPKSSLAIKLAVQAKTVGKDDPEKILDVLDEWLVKAFGKAGLKKVKARLDDPEDLLDTPHLMQLMEAVVEATTGDPTSSSSASGK